MAKSNNSSTTRRVLLYFGLMSLLVTLVNPGFLLDIPTSYMLKNGLHASPSQIAGFRLLAGIPFYVGFLFGLVRDRWSPFGKRDPGYFRLFVPLMALVLGAMALSKTTYMGLLIGMLAATVFYSFLNAAFQGLMALIGQEALMSGRMSSIFNIFLFLPIGLDYFSSGLMTEHLTPRQMFLLVVAMVGTLSIFGFWRPRFVFNHAYDKPQAKGTDLLGDVKRLLKHRAIYPVILINLLWNFMPGAFTPMQFFLTNQLHASDAVYADFSGLYNLFYLPPILLYGFLCTKFPPRKLLVWSVIIGVPQFIPMAFIHSGRQALLMAVLIGLMGGMANAGCIDIAIRACPPGLQGSMMMMIAATFALSSRGGDVVGSWIYGLSPKYGFDFCVVAITVSYALILPVIPFLPKALTATADGEPPAVGPAAPSALASC
jgi:MFS family permease